MARISTTNIDGEDINDKYRWRGYQQRLQMARIVTTTTDGEDGEGSNDEYKFRRFQRRIKMARTLTTNTDGEDINDEYRLREY